MHLNQKDISHYSERLNLTHTQNQIWLGQKLDPGVPLYNMALSHTIPARISPRRFDTAFDQLIEESDALRTVIEEQADGTPNQRVVQAVRGLTEHLDLSNEDDPSAACRELLSARCARPFDLTRRLFDSALIRLGEEKFVWFLNIHHLVNDVLSAAIILKRLSELYEHHEAGRQDLEPALMGFADFVDFESDRRSSDRGTRAKLFWQSRAADRVPPLEFFGRPTPEGALKTERLVCDLGTERSQRIRRIATDTSVRSISTDMSLFNIFAALLIAYIHRISGGDQLSIGAPISCRTSPKFRETIGLLIELFPIDVEVTKGETFESLLAKVRNESHLTISKANPGSSSVQANASIGVVLNYVNATFGTFAGTAVETEWIHCGYGDRGHAVRVHVHDFTDTGRLALFFDLASEVFDASHRESATRQFLCIVDAFLENRGACISGIPLCSESERSTLTRVNRSGATSLEPLETVVSLFERQARTAREKTVIRSGTVTMSAGQLEDQAKALARKLRALGVGPRVRVALVMRRSVGFVVSALAVLKAGGAYVPVDPSDPELRRTMILEDADVGLVITDDPRLRDSPLVAVQTCTFDELDSSPVDPFDDDALRLPALDPKNPAYVVFTSGSTGRPKGVVVTHGNLSNYVAWARRSLASTEEPVFALFTSISVDLTVTSIWVPLVAGGTLVVYEDPFEADELSIHRVLKDDQVDILKLTPTHLALAERYIGATRRLKTLIVGGENLRTDLARAIHQAGEGRIRIINEYGPTETTVGCTHHVFQPEQKTGSFVPVGQPADNVGVYVLDECLNPLPPGLTGEVFVSGNGVADGYLGLEAETEKNFVADPFRPENRMYRTGDVGRWNSHHQLEIAGRVDRQFKIRGFRVEPGEIEDALLKMPEIRECVVEAFDGKSRDSKPETGRSCVRCGLPANGFPATFNDDGVCSHCVAFDASQDKAMRYFRPSHELRSMLQGQRASNGSDYDCIMMLSGGKDSTYALCQLVDMGLRVLAYTFDNGFISETAKTNMRRIVEALGVDLIEGTTPAMNEIFADSLSTFGTVCNGCFKVIYVLATNLARQKGVRYVVTGLSRGQLFATRLSDLHREGIFDPDEIDGAVLQARKAYHRMNDAVAKNLDVEIFKDDRVFDEISFLDFYRYHDVAVEDMMTYLRNRVPWKRPSDTGCSTNCLINDVGIFVHKQSRGFHNYAFPYSWEVRLGHKTLEKADEQLHSIPDMQKIDEIIKEIGYPKPETRQDSSNRMLVAFYVSDEELDRQALRDRLAGRLPAAMIPNDFIRLPSVPLTAGGKTDRQELHRRAEEHLNTASAAVGPTTPTEEQLTQIWSEVLALEDVSVHDDFFLLGGDSIMVIQIVSKARDQGLYFSAKTLFSNPTIATLARNVTQKSPHSVDQGPSAGRLPLTPVHYWYLEQQIRPADYWNQSIEIEVDRALTQETLDSVLNEIVRCHDSLRLRVVEDSGGMQLQIEEMAPDVTIQRIDLSGVPAAEVERAIESTLQKLHQSLDAGVLPLLQGALFSFEGDHPNRLALICHHLAVDGVSWPIIVTDLRKGCELLQRGQELVLPTPDTSIMTWAKNLESLSRSLEITNERAFWSRVLEGAPDPLNQARSADSDLTRSEMETLTTHLSEYETRALMEVSGNQSRATIQEVLLASLAHALSECGVDGPLVVDVESHGRHEFGKSLDLGRTLGWFTSIFPVVIPIENTASTGSVVRVTKNALRSVPNHGLGFGLLRYLCPDAGIRQELKNLHQPTALFNFMGRNFTAEDHPSGITQTSPVTGYRNPKSQAPYSLEFNAWISDGVLTVMWNTAPDLPAQKLFEAFRASLRRMSHDLSEGLADTLVPTDFPTAGLAQSDLDDIMADFGEFQDPR